MHLSYNLWSPVIYPINRWDLLINVSTALHVRRCTCSSVYLFSLFLPFWHNMHSYLSIHLLGYVHTDVPENKSTCLSSCFSFAYEQRPTSHYNYLRVHLPLKVPVHDPTCSFSYFYTVWLTAKIYPSMFLLLYMWTDISINQHTCSVSFFFFGITCTASFLLIC